MPAFFFAIIRLPHRIKFWRFILIGSILAGLLPSCSANNFLPDPSSVFSGWKFTDLRMLQAPGSDPGHSLIALYSRQSHFDLEIRLDFLDLSRPLDFDVYLALDTQPGGSTNLPIAAKSNLDFDLLVKIPASGAPQAVDSRLNPLAGLIPRSANDPRLDILTMQLNRSSLPGNPSEIGMQAFITPAGKPDLLTQTPAVYPTAFQIAQAPLLLVFWNTLPAAAPVEILRRWDGAHTGPYGGRHGLNVLLQAAANHKIPLVLADLKQPASLTALSAVGGLDLVRQYARRGDLILPESAVGDPQLSDLSLSVSRQTAALNLFQTSSIAFGAFSDPLSGQYSTFFADLPDRSRMIGWQSKRLIPLPGPVFSGSPTDADPQVDYDGLTINARQALLLAALSPDPGDLVVLGGSLPDSAWGEFSIAPVAFEYIAAHPWIKPLAEHGLNELPVSLSENWPLDGNCLNLLCSPTFRNVTPISGSGGPVRSGFTSDSLRSELLARLEKMKPGLITQLAVQSYLSLTQPTDNLSLAGLQANALGYVGYLIEASGWDESAYTKTDCAIDLDFDGEPECILASPAWFVVIKTGGGRLVYAAQRGPAGTAQWIGSPAQFGVGLGDPSEWKPEIGPQGNPAEIPGAFAPDNAPYSDTIPEIQPGKVILNNADHTIQKVFSLNNNELIIDLMFPEPTSVLIPITLTPQKWAAGSPFEAWLPAPVSELGRWDWQPDSEAGLTILFKNNQTMNSKTSLDSIQWLGAQENPNLAYPPGHYLTFPMAVLQVQGSHINMTFTPGETP